MGFMKELYMVAIEEGYNINKLNSVVSLGILPPVEEEPKIKELIDKAWGEGCYEKIKQDIQNGTFKS